MEHIDNLKVSDWMKLWEKECNNEDALLEDYSSAGSEESPAYSIRIYKSNTHSISLMIFNNTINIIFNDLYDYKKFEITPEQFMYLFEIFSKAHDEKEMKKRKEIIETCKETLNGIIFSYQGIQ